jgi:hypothetical protein
MAERVPAFPKPCETLRDPVKYNESNGLMEVSPFLSP